MKIDVKEEQFGNVITVSLDNGKQVSASVKDDDDLPDVLRKLAGYIQDEIFDPE